MSASRKTSELGEPTLKRREFLAAGGATIAATTFGEGAVDQMGERVLQYLTLDVSWKSRIVAALRAEQGTDAPDSGKELRFQGALERLRKQHLWGHDQALLRHLAALRDLGRDHVRVALHELPGIGEHRLLDAKDRAVA